MLVRDLIRLFKSNWIPTEEFQNLDKKTEVTRETLKQSGVSAKTLAYFDSIPLWSVRGIGPAKAVELWAKGVRPGNLEKHTALLPEATVLSLKYHPLNAIPHDTVAKIADQFTPPGEKSRITVVGSYRRKRPFSGDVDLMYTGPDLQKFLDKVQALHGKRWILFGQGPSKIAGIFRFTPTKSVEVDLWIARPDAKHAMLLFSTGSKNFNIRMRFIAKKRGMKLDQYGLWDVKTGKLIPTSSERDIFEKIGMRYRKPEER